MKRGFSYVAEAAEEVEERDEWPSKIVTLDDLVNHDIFENLDIDKLTSEFLTSSFSYGEAGGGGTGEVVLNLLPLD
jgi:hypothetical protein